MKKEIPECGIIPPWYGVAYPVINAARAVCYPIPFNILVRWGREIWMRIKCGKSYEMSRLKQRMAAIERRNVKWDAIKESLEFENNLLQGYVQTLERALKEKGLI